MRLLYAEDEEDLREVVAAALREQGYSLDVCRDGEEALDFLQAAEYDGLILDIMMPQKSGLEVLKQVRKAGIAAPVLLLTARDAVEDRVLGLDSGANDYLVKPFALSELFARVRAMLRVPFGMTENVLTAADLRLDLSRHQVTRAGEIINLSAKEFALLEYLMRNRGVVLQREKIENHIWDFGYEGGTNVVDVYISYLRRKVDAGREKPLIQTVRGVGYKLSEEKEP